MSKDFFGKLMVPVHPEYDFEDDPSKQADYANPVTLSNMLVLHANAIMELTKSIVNVSKQREKTRLELRDVERQLNDMRRAVLSRHPITSTAAKNLQLTDAHVVAGLEADGLLDGYKKLEQKSAALEDKIEGLKSQEEDFKYTVHTIKVASENIVAKLAYTKHEVQMSRLGV